MKLGKLMLCLKVFGAVLYLIITCPVFTELAYMVHLYLLMD